MITTKYQVTGMSCGHCEQAVTDEVNKISGVKNIIANAEKGTLTVESATPLEDALVVAAVDEAGYQAARV